MNTLLATALSLGAYWLSQLLCSKSPGLIRVQRQQGEWSPKRTFFIPKLRLVSYNP